MELPVHDASEIKITLHYINTSLYNVHWSSGIQTWCDLYFGQSHWFCELKAIILRVQTKKDFTES